MPKPQIKTLELLQMTLDEDLAWRKKELTTIRSLVLSKSSKETIDLHIRSGIALTYAHWEGFIKAAGQAYLAYIACQRLHFSELSNNFITIAAKGKLTEARQSNKMTAYAQITEFFMAGLDETCNLPIEIETKSNLSSEVLREITYILGVDYREYETKADLIDRTLLKSRNEIAHGKYLTIGLEQFLELLDEVIQLLNLFSNQISNAASLKTYKKVVPQ